MKTDDFDFHLPPERIAQVPADRREQSRMLVLHRESGTIEHARFTSLPDYVHAGDLLVLNDTRVFPARLLATKARTGGKVELLLLEETTPDTWEVLLRASRRPQPGDRLQIAGGVAVATLVADGAEGKATLRITSTRPFREVVEEVGLTPLPPYIKRGTGAGEEKALDVERYQTVYANQSGAVAAPTAGLHFTGEMLTHLEERGVPNARITLHVGLGTFRPVSVANVEDHVMESERYEISPAAAAAIRAARERNGRIVAVGSTTVRTLETVAAEHGSIVPCRGRTRRFIYPPYQPAVVDVLLTNFHLPRSTLLMMVSAIAGRDLTMKAYAEAIREGYRFYSYGDCMLII